VSTPALVQDFYERIWNGGDDAAALELLADDFTFRGSLGPSMQGRDAFLVYVRAVRGSLADYRCEILACVAEGRQAFARMRFSGRHTGEFRGHAPTGKVVAWQGAALFTFAADRIADLWVLGDLAGLDEALRADAAS
jgi:steroid delta-isomerase-like uncharacterized protein